MFRGLKFVASKIALQTTYIFEKTRDLCYDACNDWLDELPEQTPVPNHTPILDAAALRQMSDEAKTGTEASLRPKPTIMRGYLVVSFEEGSSLGMAAMTIAIDEIHARQLLSQELKERGLRLEDDDKLIEIDLHNPSVTLESNLDEQIPRSFPDSYSGW